MKYRKTPIITIFQYEYKKLKLIYSNIIILYMYFIKNYIMKERIIFFIILSIGNITIYFIYRITKITKNK